MEYLVMHVYNIIQLTHVQHKEQFAQLIDVHKLPNCFNTEEFITMIKESPLCQPVDLSSSATDLANCYHSEITLAPVTEIFAQLCPQRMFYDGDCRLA